MSLVQLSLSMVGCSGIIKNSSRDLCNGQNSIDVSRTGEI